MPAHCDSCPFYTLSLSYSPIQPLQQSGSCSPLHRHRSEHFCHTVVAIHLLDPTISICWTRQFPFVGSDNCQLYWVSSSYVTEPRPDKTHLTSSCSLQQQEICTLWAMSSVTKCKVANNQRSSKGRSRWKSPKMQQQAAGCGSQMAEIPPTNCIPQPPPLDGIRVPAMTPPTFLGWEPFKRLLLVHSSGSKVPFKLLTSITPTSYMATIKISHSGDTFWRKKLLRWDKKNFLSLINVLLIRMAKRRPMCPLRSKLALHETNPEQKVSMCQTMQRTANIALHCTAWGKRIMQNNKKAVHRVHCNVQSSVNAPNNDMHYIAR